MTWHDLIDDTSVRRFVSAGEESWATEDFRADTDEEQQNSAVDVTEPPPTNASMYDTEILSASEISNLSDSGITIVPSVPSANDNGEVAGGDVRDARDVPLFSASFHDSDSLSLNPSSVASSALTEDSMASSISEISESSADTPIPTDRSYASSDDLQEHLSPPQENQLDESQLKALYLQQENTEQCWEENKESILEVLKVLEADNKDPDSLLAQLYAEEEAFFAQVQKTKQRERSLSWFIEVATAGAAFGLATAVFLRMLRQR